MRVSLFIPCFVDALEPRVGLSIAKVLERLGHTVDYPEAQTCCGQPPFNSGYWGEARIVAAHQLEVFRDADVVVSASGSCGAMFKVFYPELFHGTREEKAARELAAKTHEFSEFLFSTLRVTDVGARFPARVTFHDGCHGLRELKTHDAPRALLRAVKGLDLIEMSDAQTCCGFGGMFAVKFPQISTAMAEVKCDAILGANVDYVVSNDSSCLMQIQGYLSRHSDRPVRSMHIAEVLASE